MYTVPLTGDEMIRQAASVMKDAATTHGLTRQIVRILVPRDRSFGDLGRMGERSSNSNNDVTLIPPDESWQGGIMQLYRACAPVAEDLVRLLVKSDSGVPPRITEDRSVDESGVDGIGVWTTQDASVTCWVQPTQEVVPDMERMAQSPQYSNSTIVLLNPQWRNMDDALDTASQGEGFLANVASFLGGKGNSLKRLQAAGFQPVYTLEGYVCRNTNIRLLHVFDSDWQVFAERNNGESFWYCGSTPTRPSYQQVDSLLKQTGFL
jgi:hypothetical protein